MTSDAIGQINHYGAVDAPRLIVAPAPRRRPRGAALSLAAVLSLVPLAALVRHSVCAPPAGDPQEGERTPEPSASFCSPADGTWRVAWRDEFDGDALDQSKWAPVLGRDEGSMRAARGLADNVWVADGALVLRTARAAAAADDDYDANDDDTSTAGWTSGAVTTRGRAAWAGRARVCVRARLPGATPPGGDATSPVAVANASQGIWPAHWLLPDDVRESDAYAPPDARAAAKNGSCWPDKVCRARA